MKTEKIDKIFDVVFSILLFSLSLSVAIPNILLIPLFLIFIAKKNKIIFLEKYTKILLLFVSYLLIKAVFFNNFADNFILYKLLLILVTFSFLSFNIKNVNFVLKGYILGVVFSVLISFYKIIIFYFEHKVLPFGNTSEVQDLILIHLHLE